MSEDAIAALFASAQAGQPPEAATERPGAVGPKVAPVDFRRPRQFTGEIQRRLRRSIDTLCRTAGSRLSTELRTAVDLEVIAVDQLTWSDAHGALPSSSVTAVLAAEPLKTRMLLAAELGLLLSSIERMLGGGGEVAPPPRRLTDIDLMLAGEIFELVSAQLSILWGELMEVETSIVGVVSHQQTAQLAPTSEPTLSLTLEAKLLGVSSALVLLIPYRSIVGVVDRLTVVEGLDPSNEIAARDMRSGIGTVSVEVRAEIGAVERPAAEVLEIKAGDVIGFDRRASAGVTLWVDDTIVGHGAPGRSGTHRAVQKT